MENAARWIFSLVMAALLFYACIDFRDTRRELLTARERVQALCDTREALRRDNEYLSRLIGMTLAEKAPD